MLISVGGKISTGAADDFDVYKDFRCFCALSKKFVLVTNNPDHPAFQVDEDNLHIILADALVKLKSE